jgi:photosystem II stability/assembly factor-like uncharacterized protein
MFAGELKLVRNREETAMKWRLVVMLMLWALVRPQMASAEDWQWVSPLPTGNNICGAAWVGDRAWIVDDAGVVLRSSNNGDSWDWQNTAFRVPWPIMTFVDSLYGWVAGGVANSGVAGLINHTTDGGQTWTQQANGIGRFNLDIDFVDRDVGWVLNRVDWYDGPNRVLGTSNGGADWNIIFIATSTVGLTAIDFVSPLLGWGVGRDTDSARVFRTLDGGRTWDPQIGIDDSYFYDLSFVDSLYGWAISSAGVLCRTTDGGSSWTCARPDTGAGGPSSIKFADRQHGWIVTGRFARGVLSTSDGGETWSQFIPGARIDVGKVTCRDAEHAMVTSTIGRLYRTNNGGTTWTDVSWRRPWQGLCTAAFADSLHGWLVGGRGAADSLSDVIWHTSDGGANWSEQSQGVQTPLRAAKTLDPSTAWALGSNGRLLHTTDGGASWVVEIGLAGQVVADFDFVDALHGVAAGGQTIYLTSDGGLTWTAQDSTSWETLSDVAYADAENVWAVGWREIHTNPGGCVDSTYDIAVILHSSDAGLSWEDYDLNGSDWSPAHVVFADAQTGYLTSAWSRAVFRTADGGETWTPLPFPARNTLELVTPSQGQDVWAFGDTEDLLHSRDGGTTWIQEPLVYAHWLTGLSIPDSDHVWVVGPNSIVFRYGGPPVSGAEWRQVTVPEAISLSAYPNPFNPLTNLEFSVPTAGRTRLDVYDLNGRLVKGLEDRVMSAGSYRFTFDGTNHSSGVYFVRLLSPSSSLTKKIALIK